MLNDRARSVRNQGPKRHEAKAWLLKGLAFWVGDKQRRISSSSRQELAAEEGPSCRCSQHYMGEASETQRG